MSLDRLWAGWRVEYLESETGPDGSSPKAGAGGSGAGGSGAGVTSRVAGAGGTPAPPGPPSARSIPGDLDSGRPPGDPDCVFCRILGSGKPDSETHVVWRHPTGLVVALLNAYPYTSGHVMVMPVRHVGELESLTAGESSALMDGLTGAVRAIKAAYRPDGLNAGANLGRAAGAGVPGHLHLHVLPRWVGDTNFMTSVAEARVLPEPLSASAERIRSGWAD
jgi:ATP adenylyltransferase